MSLFGKRRSELDPVTWYELSTILMRNQRKLQHLLERQQQIDAQQGKQPEPEPPPEPPQKPPQSPARAKFQRIGGWIALGLVALGILLTIGKP